MDISEFSAATDYIEDEDGFKDEMSKSEQFMC